MIMFILYAELRELAPLKWHEWFKTSAVQTIATFSCRTMSGDGSSSSPFIRWMKGDGTSKGTSKVESFTLIWALVSRCNRFIHHWAQNLSRTDDAGAEIRLFFKTTPRNYFMANFRGLCIYDYSIKNCVTVKIPLSSAAASNHIFLPNKKEAIGESQ